MSANLWYSEKILKRLEGAFTRYIKLIWMSEEQRQIWNLLEPRSFDMQMKAITLIVAMLGCSKIDTEILDNNIKTAEFGKYIEILRVNYYDLSPSIGINL